MFAKINILTMVLLYVWVVKSDVQLASIAINALLAVKQPSVYITTQTNFAIAELVIIKHLRRLNYVVFVILAA